MKGGGSMTTADMRASEADMRASGTVVPNQPAAPPALVAEPLEAQPVPAQAPVADPGPLGLAGFAMTTFVLSVFNANIIGDKKLEAVVLPLALFYGGIAQLLAGMWEFRKANTFGATAFASYGAFWLSFAAYVKFVLPGMPASTAHQATGLYLLAWLRLTGVLVAVFTVLTITFALLTAGAFGQYPNVTKAGGITGLITAGLAWYASCAGLANETWKRTVLPTFPLRH